MYPIGGDEADWSPGELENEWLEAIELLEPAKTPGFRDYEAAQLTQFLATHYPDHLAQWVRSRLENGLETRLVTYDALPHSAWGTLHHLPTEQKDELWLRFRTGPAGQFLSEYLVGQDADWLEHALEEGLMTTDEVLRTYNALGPHPSIEQLARLLVPRGVDARRIALFAEEGGWDGEDSARYGKLHKRFQELAQSEEEAVAAVGCCHGLLLPQPPSGTVYQGPLTACP
jgi:hypothetical protein